MILGRSFAGEPSTLSSTLPAADTIERLTLENAIYMGMKNDLAFIINTNLFLYEH